MRAQASSSVHFRAPPTFSTASLGDSKVRHIRLLTLLLFSGCASAPAPQYPSPTEFNVALSGRVPTNLQFSLEVKYVAGADRRHCKTYNFVAGMLVAQTKSYRYQPTRRGAEYSVIVPLREIDPSGRCHWAPAALMLCLGTTIDNPLSGSCQSILFFDTGRDDARDMTFQCRLGDFSFCHSLPKGLHTGSIPTIGNRKLRMDLELLP